MSVSRASSSNRVNSAEDLASRDTSNPNTAPTSPRHTREISPRNPSRSLPNRPDTPRSASTTAMLSAAHPNPAATAANPYCRPVDSP